MIRVCEFSGASHLRQSADFKNSCGSTSAGGCVRCPHISAADCRGRRRGDCGESHAGTTVIWCHRRTCHHTHVTREVTTAAQDRRKHKNHIYKLILFLLIFDKVPNSPCDNYPLIQLRFFQILFLQIALILCNFLFLSLTTFHKHVVSVTNLRNVSFFSNSLTACACQFPTMLISLCRFWYTMRKHVDI